MAPIETPTVLHTILDNATELSDSTRDRYRHDLDEWLIFVGRDPKGWTSIRTQDWYRHLASKRQLQVNTINVKIASLRYVSKWYAKHYKGDEFTDIRISSWNQKPNRHVLSQEQIVMLLEHCSPDEPTPIDIRDRAIIIVGLETGMRRISLVGLDFDKIDTTDGYPVATVPVKGRANKKFEVPLSDCAWRALKDWQNTLGRKHGRVFCNLVKRSSKNGFLTYSPGKSISTSAINKILTNRAKAAGIEHVHPHLFRNTYVTDRLKNGMMPHHVSAVTGHTLGLGAMAGYVDMRELANVARSSTPPWFKMLVERLVPA